MTELYIHTLNGFIAIHDLRIYYWVHLAIWTMFNIIYYGPLYLNKWRGRVLKNKAIYPLFSTLKPLHSFSGFVSILLYLLQILSAPTP